MFCVKSGVRPMSDRHIRWIDSWRGLMILLVVFWHSLGGLLETSSQEHLLSRHLYEFIANFHMVAFFAISGFVWRHNARGLFCGIKDNFLRLMVPYYCFSILGLMVCVAMFYLGFGGEARTITNSVLDMIVAGRPPCYSPMWFLSCLFMILVIVSTIPPKAKGVATLAVGVVILAYFEKYCFRYYYSCNIFNFAVVPRYLLMFLIGHILANWCKREFHVRVEVRVILLVIGIVGLIVFAWNNIFVVPKMLAFMIPVKAIGIIVSTMLIAFSIDNRLLSWIGKGELTLGILCLHKYPIVLCQKALCSRPMPGVYFVIIATLVTIISVAFSILATTFLYRHFPWVLGKVSKRKEVLQYA